MLSNVPTVSYAASGITATFNSVGIDGWVSRAITAVEIHFAGDEAKKFADCVSLTQQLDPTLEETVGTNTDGVHLGLAKISTLGITNDGIDCKYLIGFAYTNIIALSNFGNISSDSPSTLNLKLSGKLLASATTIFRVPGLTQITTISPTRGATVGLNAEVKIGYSLGQGEIAPTNWKIEVYNSEGNQIGNVPYIKTGLDTWKFSFPDSGIYRVHFSGETNIPNCNFPANSPTATYGKCPTKILDGDVPIQVDKKASSTASEITYSYDWSNPLFKRISPFPFEMEFICPDKVSGDGPFITCSAHAISHLTQQDVVQILGFAAPLTVTGEIPLSVCAANSEDLYQKCDLSEVSNFYLWTKIVKVGFTSSAKIEIPNYLASRGYVQIDAGAPIYITSNQRIIYKIASYDSNQQKIANTPPPNSLISSTAAQIRKAMMTKCQKLPSGFSRFPIKYSKKLDSFNTNGLPGYVFIVNSKLYLQVLDLQPGLNITPSPTSADNKLFRSWGCGNAAIVSN